jgi:hypothetical protein
MIAAVMQLKSTHWNTDATTVSPLPPVQNRLQQYFSNSSDLNTRLFEELCQIPANDKNWIAYIAF